MPASQRIQPQDPSLSPTFSMSMNHAQTSGTNSIRRNLFASHLSRRPTSNASQNSFGPPSPTNDGYVPANLLSGPALQSSKRNIAFNDIYDPDASPPSYKTASSINTLSRENVVALHPVTGRPLLPNIPNLPPRLRLSDEDEEGEEDSDIDQDRHQSHGNPGFVRSPSYHSNLNHVLPSDFDFDADMDLDSSELERLNAFNSSVNLADRINLHQFLDTNSEESQADRERIEYLLSEMVTRQRARARTIPEPQASTITLEQDSDVHVNNSISDASSNPTSINANGSRRRIARQVGAPSIASRSKTKNSSSTNVNQTFQVHDDRYMPLLPDASKTIDLGKVLDPSEKSELISLIMAGLRRKVAIADEEGWMYGDLDGNGGFGVSGGVGLEPEGFD